MSLKTDYDTIYVSSMEFLNLQNLARPSSCRCSLKQKICLTIDHLVCINTHMDSRMIIKMLQKDGWYKADQSGSHIQFRHPSKKGRVTVPHPKKDIPIGTLRSIERQSGIKFK